MPEPTTLSLRAIGPDHDERVLSDGTRQVEIAPAGSNLNYADAAGAWTPCDATVVTELAGASGRSRSVYTAMPLTVGVRTDAEAEELVTLRLSSDPSKASEITISLVDIEDAGPGVTKNNRPQNCTLSEHEVAGQVIHKHDQSVHVVDQNTLRLLTPRLRPITSRTVTYALTLPAGYEIRMGETWPEIHGPAGCLRAIRTALLDADMQPVCDEAGLLLDAISLEVVAHGEDAEGRKLYALVKKSKIDLTSVAWAWFDVELALCSYSFYTERIAYSTWAEAQAATSAPTIGNTPTNPISVVCGRYNDTQFQISRAFLNFDLSNITATAVSVQLKLVPFRLEGSGWPHAPKIMVQAASMNPATTNTTAKMQACHHAYASPVYAENVTTALGTTLYIDLPLAAVKNNVIDVKSYTSLAVREYEHDFLSSPPANSDSYGMLFGETPAQAAKLILVYAHAGPSKTIYTKSSLVPASGRIQFPMRITRDTTEGAAVLDGLLDLNYTSSNFEADTLGQLPANMYGNVANTFVIVDALDSTKKAVQIGTASTDGELYPTKNRPWVLRPPVDYTLSMKYYFAAKPGGSGAALFLHFDSSTTQYSMMQIQYNANQQLWNICEYVYEAGAWVWKSLAINITSASDITVTKAGSDITVKIGNYTKTITNSLYSTLKSTIRLNAWQGCILCVQELTVTCAKFDGDAADLHFRKASGALIQAFSRSVTKDAQNAITQIDCRLSVDVADLPGLTLCYGDLAYTDFAVDASQITGTTIAEAEASPLPGTFWSWDAFASLLSKLAHVTIAEQFLPFVLLGALDRFAREIAAATQDTTTGKDLCFKYTASHPTRANEPIPFERKDFAFPVPALPETFFWKGVINFPETPAVGDEFLVCYGDSAYTEKSQPVAYASTADSTATVTLESSSADSVNCAETTSFIADLFAQAQDLFKSGEYQETSAEFQSAATDSCVGADTPALFLTVLKTGYDGLRASESFATTHTLVSALLDTAGLSEANLRAGIARQHNVADVVTSADSSDKTMALVAAASDTIKGSESFSTVAAFVSALLDSVKADDLGALGNFYTTLVSDSIGLSEGLTSVATLLALLEGVNGDRLFGGESVGSRLSTVCSGADAVKGADTNSVLYSILRSATDAVKAGEGYAGAEAVMLNTLLESVTGVEATLVGIICDKLGADAAKGADTTAAALSLSLAVLDAVKGGEARLANLIIPSALGSDAVKLGDAPALYRTMLAAVADSVKTTDISAVDAIIAYLEVVADGLKSSASAQNSAVLAGSAQESLRAVDALAAVLVAGAVTAEGLKLGEAVSSAAILEALSAETLKLFDTNIATLITLAAALDSVSVTETAAGLVVAGAIELFASDAIGFNELVGLVLAIEAKVNETVPVRERCVSIADSTGPGIEITVHATPSDLFRAADKHEFKLDFVGSSAKLKAPGVEVARVTAVSMTFRIKK